MSGKRIWSHVWSLLLFGAIVTCSGITLPMRLQEGRSIVVDVAFIIFGSLMFAMAAYSWYRDQGAAIKIQGNSISVVSPTGKVRINGLLTNVIQLKAMQPISQNVPTAYIVVFTGGRRISFSNSVPNVDGLLHLIQVRTGKQFVVQRS